MSSATALYERYSIGKTYFYQRRDYLIESGYNMEAEKNGRKNNYIDDQVKPLDAFHAHIKETGGIDGFPHAEPIAANKTAEQQERNELVHAEREEIEVDESTTDIYVDTNPLADIQEQQLASVDVAALYSAAQNLTAFNYLTVDYMKHRDFSVEELAEEIHKSEQAVRESFGSMMENPASATKKILARVRRQRKNAIA